LQVQADGRQHLAEVVVQLAGDGAPFSLLRFQQPVRQLFPGTLAVGDVDGDPEGADDLARPVPVGLHAHLRDAVAEASLESARPAAQGVLVRADAALRDLPRLLQRLAHQGTIRRLEGVPTVQRMRRPESVAQASAGICSIVPPLRRTSSSMEVARAESSAMETSPVVNDSGLGRRRARHYVRGSFTCTQDFPGQGSRVR